MIKQLIFTFVLIATLGIFGYTVRLFYRRFKVTKTYTLKDWGQRIGLMLKVAIGQTKIFRFPVVGLFHALVFWGFILITFGSLEMVFDGVLGIHRTFSFLGGFYEFLIGAGDIFGYLIFLLILVFLVRRLAIRINRFYGSEMKPVSKIDANLSLLTILLLMVSLIGINICYLGYQQSTQQIVEGVYPVSQHLTGWVFTESPASLWIWHEVFWWIHILLIFAFANALPYSKHFHVFMSVPNVLLSRLEPLGKLDNMESVMNEIRLMMNPEAMNSSTSSDTAPPSRFGVLDVEDITWKNYFDSLSCTECGRCTSVCPANITGKKLSPRKIIMDVRARMKEKIPGFGKNPPDPSTMKTLVKEQVSAEELWACNTCNACAQECPININHPTLIVDMRRYLMMEESAAPSGLNSMFSNVENNGAPWQYSRDDRMKWAENIVMNV